ncbi:ribulose-phosphate 3-epimerase [Fastidiosibacter lacustris]|uniref:ribulose-phosphate 3-epimerase n=1 Tax=Fastidiosibacter lacustris TaxID=2056695 RepID=UPI000E349313|nr:ribulose-phosphate 3-epimerase [Fastidiosibacter lacustris]
MSYQINPSILSANLAHLGDDVRAVLKAGANNIHFDVMDNHYVPNLTFGAMILKALREDGISVGMDVHLMVEPVDDLIESFAQAGATSIVFHPEASRHVDRSLSLIQSFGIEAGLALNPATSITICDYLIDKLDRLLIMTVNPGFGGQIFIPAMYHKIKQVSQWIKTNNDNILLEVDGGVRIDNIAEIAACGADAFVAGSAIFDTKNYKQVIDQMRKMLLEVKK